MPIHRSNAAQGPSDICSQVPRSEESKEPDRMANVRFGMVNIKAELFALHCTSDF